MAAALDSAIIISSRVQKSEQSFNCSLAISISVYILHTCVHISMCVHVHVHVYANHTYTFTTVIHTQCIVCSRSLCHAVIVSDSVDHTHFAVVIVDVHFAIIIMIIMLN